MSSSNGTPPTGNEIAIVGMAAHLPGARDVRDFWRNLEEGVESVRPYTDDELREAKVPPHLLRHPRYVRSGAPLHDMEHFDAEFFGFSPKEAAILDPQHRHFLEACWEALEDAGHVPERFPGSIGVFGGCGMGAYFAFNLLSNPRLVEQVGLFLLRHTGNDKDFLATRVSYVLDLKGPSINVQTACSTSLVAVHVAAQSLLSGECDLALAGGVTIELPHRQGYLFEEGEILSPDGHCRAFDAQSQGTVFGSGVAVVALRRLADAIEAGDHVYAVLKGSAVNNDGAGKVGYLAPSIDGQSAAIAEALAIAEVSADRIGYVECHGTGTPMGDPIEVAALTQAYRGTTKRSGYCAIGSVKSNIGHLDTAAGAAGLIKAALALEHGLIPKSLHYGAANPNIDFASSPFFVAKDAKPWPRGPVPRYAAVNSLGVGGTNAHAVLEEPPAARPGAPSTRPAELLVLSARSRAALDQAQARLAAHLAAEPGLELADVAYTLAVGRRVFEQRRVLAAANRDEALAILTGAESQRTFTHQAPSRPASVVFMFPGGGAQHPKMGRGLYEHEPVYREWVDRGLDALRTRHGLDLAPLLFAPDERLPEIARELERPALQLPALFVVEMALARLWMSRGVEPVALIGHSMGENTAACLAGVLSYEDALGLIVLRGALFERVPEGGMLSVPLPAEELAGLLDGELDLATVNAPALCVASGPVAGLAVLERRLAERSVEAQRIPIAIAAHSRMLEPILAEFRAYLRRVKLSPPKIPFVSNRTGSWITAAEATDPDYWVAHLRGTILFSQGVRTLVAGAGPRVLLEVGPGRTLSSLARQQPDLGSDQLCLSSLRHPDEKVADATYFAAVEGRLWAAGVPLDLEARWRGESRRRVPLPAYPFQRQRFWIEPGTPRRAEESHLVRAERREDWYWRGVWRERPLPLGGPSGGRWLVFLDTAGVGRRLVESLRAGGCDVVSVREGDRFHRIAKDEFALAPEHGRAGYDELLRELAQEGRLPNRILHGWGLTSDETFRPGSSFFHRNQERGFWSLFFLGQALAAEAPPEPVHVVAVVNGMLQVAGEPLRYPDKATLLGPARVLPRELAGCTCRAVDVDLPLAPSNVLASRQRFKQAMERVTAELVRELAAPPDVATVAWRDGRRFAEEFERGTRPSGGEDVTPQGRLRERGVVLVTGGLGGLGLTAARALARQRHARLALVGRSRLPERERWDDLLRRLEPEEPLAKRLRQVLELEALGGEVLTLSADVTDVEEMRAVVARVRERFGAIHGVLHTAGVVDDGVIAAKDQARVEAVLAPKVHGTLVLDEVLQGEELDFLALFSSASVAIAAPGQADYVAANAFLEAYARSRAGGKTRVFAIGWGVWSDVGMAASAVQPAASGPRSSSARHPLFTERRGDGRVTTDLFGTWTARGTWVLDDHRSGSGTALLPGTGVLELARAALAEIGEERPFQVADLTFFRPLVVPDAASVAVRVRLEPDEEGFACDVASLATLDDGRQGWLTHAQARLLLAPLDGPRPLDLGAVQARLAAVERAPAGEALETRQARHLGFGPRWQVLRALWRGEGEGLAEVALDEAFAGDVAAFGLHPALVDLATGFGLEVAAHYDPAVLWVPVAYRRVRVHGPLPARCMSYVRVHPSRRAGGDVCTLDAVIADAEGRVLVEVEAFSMKRLERGADVAKAPPPRAAELDFDERAGASGERPLSPAERALRENIDQGIPPAAGAEELVRLLDRGVETVPIVSTLDLLALRRQVDEAVSASEGDDDVTFARPELDSAYVEPRDDLERTLVGFWQELLGVDRVGVEDDFFELGGHSLIAVRLFARVRKTFQVDYPISVLFEAPTIARVAALLRETLGAAATAATAAGAHANGSPPAPSRQRRYTYLVPMHLAEGSERTPFFLVAGMFGNVLNLRHLAGLIGRDRPVWGLQARGLYGDDEPHATFEDAARDYLAELRTVQPNGPYLLGGFSGGGLTAYEMAQQLAAAGEEVALLVLLDTPLPVRPGIARRDKAVIHLQRFQRQGWGYLTSWVQSRIAWEIGRLRKRFDDFSDEAAPTTFHSKAIEAAFRAALPRYQVGPYAGRVTLYRPKLPRMYDLGGGRFANQDRELVFPDNGWSPLVQDLEVVEVPGDHDSMVLEPNVRVLAARMRRAIEHSEAAARAP